MLWMFIKSHHPVMTLWLSVQYNAYRFTIQSTMRFEVSYETTGSLWEALRTGFSSQQSVGLTASENLMWINGLSKKTNSEHQAPAAQDPNCYLCCRLNLITGRPRGQAGHWEHRDEQTIRYYLKESSAFRKKMVPLSVTLTIGSSTWHWISHLRRMNTASHSCILTKIMTALFHSCLRHIKGRHDALPDWTVQKLEYAADTDEYAFTMTGYWMNNYIVFFILCLCK